ncbi:MAG: hypothetical protein LBO69_05280, partial [Ignavibacteria bacterium]|nr:hypothetical protein [Ignavibacteria bacterium]
MKIKFNTHLVNGVNDAIKTFIPENSKLYKYLYIMGMKATKWLRFRTIDLLQLYVPITAHCNLNCRSCSTFCPVAEPGFTDANALQKDFNRLSALSDGTIREMIIYGGEPLLHNQINEIMLAARRSFPRQDKTRQDKTRQDKTRQDKTRQDKTRQDKTRQDKTRQDK